MARNLLVSPQPGAYPTIRDALEVATPGCTISIAPGTYEEALAVSDMAVALVANGAAGSVTVDAVFTDPGPLDTHTCSVIWDQDTQTPAVPGNLSEQFHSCSATRVLSAGVYSVRVTVRDNDGGEGSATIRVVVVDPRAGSAAGHGQVWSPHGALTAEPKDSGHTTFEFDAAYKHGATRPTGEAELHFRRFHFQSLSYEWLVVAGSKAQIGGSGKVNGKPGFTFLLTAYDDDPHGSCRDERGHELRWEDVDRSPDLRSAPDETGHHGHHPVPGIDKFRLKVWNSTTGAVVYDNVPRAPDDIDSASPEAIYSGCVVIGHPAGRRWDHPGREHRER